MENTGFEPVIFQYLIKRIGYFISGFLGNDKLYG